MALIANTAIGCQGGGNHFRLAIDAWVDGTTVYANLIMYAQGNYVPYYQWQHWRYMTINGTWIMGDTGQYPSSDGQWWYAGTYIGDRTYYRAYTIGGGSVNVGAAGGTITIYGEYSVSGSAYYLPNIGTYSVSGTVYVAPQSIWNDINAWNPAVNTQNSLTFDLATSDGGRWYNITNEPTDMARPSGTTATISNIRPNITGTYYSKNSVTNTNASSFNWTINTANYSVEIYSAWNNYTVSYNANGGSSTPASQSCTHGNSVTLANAISRNNGVSTANETITVSYNANGGSSTPGNTTGSAVNTTTTTYTFNGWHLNSASGTTYSAGANYSATSNVTFYAGWNSSSSTARTSNPSIKLANAISRNTDTLSSYVVSYNANGGSSTPSSQTATKTRSYTFGGWNANSGGTGTNYSAATNYTFSANTTLYAKWSSSDSGGSITLPAAISRANSSTTGYTVSYNANGGSGAPSSQTSGNRTITYAFNKWAAGSASGTTYNAGASYTPTANTTMYATWTSTTNANSAWTCSSTVPTRTGYTFLGWSTNSGATTPTYTAGTAYTITSNLTLYAVWQVNYYYLDLNGYLDGVSANNIANYGKCEVYINGSKVASQVTDYYTQHPYGSSYEITNINPEWGIKYNGPYSGSVKGTIGAGNVSVSLSFSTLPVVVNANKDGTWRQGIVWVNVNGEWTKAKALNIRQESDWKRLEKFDFTL